MKKWQQLLAKVLVFTVLITSNIGGFAGIAYAAPGTKTKVESDYIITYEKQEAVAPVTDWTYTEGTQVETVHSGKETQTRWVLKDGQWVEEKVELPVWRSEAPAVEVHFSGKSIGADWTEVNRQKLVKGDGRTPASDHAGETDHSACDHGNTEATHSHEHEAPTGHVEEGARLSELEAIAMKSYTANRSIANPSFNIEPSAFSVRSSFALSARRSHRCQYGGRHYNSGHPHGYYVVCQICGDVDTTSSSYKSSCSICNPPKPKPKPHACSFGGRHYNSGHPHGYYVVCGGCNRVESTSSSYDSSCSICNPPKHRCSYGGTQYESSHPHRSYRKCSCGDQITVNSQNRLPNCVKCGTHRCKYGEKHYNASHPHGYYVVCQGCDDVKSYASDFISSCKICNPPKHECAFEKIKQEKPHPHRSYKECSCGKQVTVSPTNEVANCIECGTHRCKYGGKHYNASHPHGYYVVCQECDDVKSYASDFIASCKICNPPKHECTRQYVVEKAHPHKKYVHCKDCKKLLEDVAPESYNSDCEECRDTHKCSENRQYVVDEAHPHKKYVACNKCHSIIEIIAPESYNKNCAECKAKCDCSYGGRHYNTGHPHGYYEVCKYCKGINKEEVGFVEIEKQEVTHPHRRIIICSICKIELRVKALKSTMAGCQRCQNETGTGGGNTSGGSTGGGTRGPCAHRFSDTEKKRYTNHDRGHGLLRYCDKCKKDIVQSDSSFNGNCEKCKLSEMNEMGKKGYIVAYDFEKEIIGQKNSPIRDGDSVILRFPNRGFSRDGRYFEVKIDHINKKQKICIPTKYSKSQLLNFIRRSNGDYEVYTEEAYNLLSEGRRKISLIDSVQFLLDCAGLIPAIGSIADVVSLLLSSAVYMAEDTIDNAINVMINVIALVGGVFGNIAKTVLKEIYFAAELAADSGVVKAIVKSSGGIAGFLDDLKSFGSNFISSLTGFLDGASAYLEGTWLKGAAALFNSVSQTVNDIGAKLNSYAQSVIETVQLKLSAVLVAGKGTSNLVSKVDEFVQLGQLTVKKNAAGEVTGWISTNGLEYGMGSTQGNRVLHVLEHLTPNPKKPLHTVFNMGKDKVLGVIDEAWALRSKATKSVLQSNGNRLLEIPMGKVIGTNGEDVMAIVIEEGTSKIISAFPKAK